MSAIYFLPDGRTLGEADFRKIRHVSCPQCFEARNPGRPPIQVSGAPEEKCCFCHAATAAGIYLLAEVSATQCGGEHP